MEIWKWKSYVDASKEDSVFVIIFIRDEIVSAIERLKNNEILLFWIKIYYSKI